MTKFTSTPRTGRPSVLGKAPVTVAIRLSVRQNSDFVRAALLSGMKKSEWMRSVLEKEVKKLRKEIKTREEL